MSKILFMLIAIASDGDEYVVRKNMTDAQCVNRLYFERNAVIDVQEMHYEVTMTFECRMQS